MAHKQSQPTPHAARGSPTPKPRRPRRTKRSARTRGTVPRTRGPFCVRMDPGLIKDCLINCTSLCFNAFRILQKNRILRLPRTSWEHKLSSYQQTCSSHHRRISVLWCSLEHKTFRILKMHGQSPLGCRVSSCSV